MSVWMLICGEILLMAIGLFSVFRPEWVGLEIDWTQWKSRAYPRVKKATNPYYIRQIRIVGVGVLLSCAAIFFLFLWLKF